MRVILKSARGGNVFQPIGSNFYQILCLFKAYMIDVCYRCHIKGFSESMDNLIFAVMKFLTELFQGDWFPVVLLNIGGEGAGLCFGHGLV